MSRLSISTTESLWRSQLPSGGQLGAETMTSAELQNKEHTVYGSLRAVANTQAKNSDSESIPTSRR